MPLERIVASGQAGWRITELRKLCSTLDPFQLANRIDRKLEDICALRNRSPKPEASKFALRDGCRKAAPRKSPQKDFPAVLGNPTKDVELPLPHSHHSGHWLRLFFDALTRLPRKSRLWLRLSFAGHRRSAVGNEHNLVSCTVCNKMIAG